jgi:hypothetical protein
MNNSDFVWGSLVASLEEECEQVFNRDSSRTSNRRVGLALPNGASVERQGIYGSTGINMNLNRNDSRGIPRDDLLARPFASFPPPNQGEYETNANLASHGHMEAVQGNAPGALNSSSATTSAMPSTSWGNAPRTIALKQWIKHTASSPDYLETALKIATSLTDQLIQADKLARYGISEKLDMLSTQSGPKWADHVVIRLKHAPLFEPGGGGSAPYGWLQLQHEDINKKLKCFWESFEQRGKEQKQLISLGTLDNNMPAVSLPTSGSVNDSSALAEDCNYLDVDIAEIRCPESPGGKTSGDEGRDTEIQRMYYLGLVFYELFSGGSVPPTELYALAASDGAFVSLPTLTLAKSSDDEDTGRPAESKRRHCRGPSGREMGLCQLSFQYLEMMDLPRPICYLIFNMLDCIYGDLGGDACYSELADVLFDLQLMQEKPAKFMRNLDMDKLSISGLHLDENAIPRNAEFECIKACYRRRVLGSYELALIRGESGSGKSWLAEKKVGKFITDEGGVFLTGKFDQMKQMKRKLRSSLQLIITANCQSSLHSSLIRFSILRTGVGI